MATRIKPLPCKLVRRVFGRPLMCKGERMERMEALKSSVGKADACELLAYAFAFPNEQLAEGLSSGALADDAEACLRDAGVASEGARQVANDLRRWQGFDAADLCSRMRTTYSRLYLVPGGHTPVFPYESAFLHVEHGLSGIPVLFRTPVTLDVERQMHEAGVAAKNERKEPCDSVFDEFEFLSFLFAKFADVTNREDTDEATIWESRVQHFLTKHAQVWLPSFMRRTQELAAGEPYAAFASLGTATMGVLK